jgi:RimJ/RimL family protein N-acetyltransferase
MWWLARMGHSFVKVAHRSACPQIAFLEVPAGGAWTPRRTVRILTAMELMTARLRLRRWRADDRAFFAAMNAEPSVGRYLAPLTPTGLTAMQERIDAHFARHGWGYWALQERDGGALIGLCGLMHVPFEAFFTPAVEISWRLSTQWQGKGLAREAAEAVLAFAFDTLKLNRVVSYTVASNAASWGLMERLGMHKVGEIDNPDLPEGHLLRRNVVYEIRAPDNSEPEI